MVILLKLWLTALIVAGCIGFLFYKDRNGCVRDWAELCGLFCCFGIVGSLVSLLLLGIWTTQ